jgi:hypothetical protein
MVIKFMYKNNEVHIIENPSKHLKNMGFVGEKNSKQKKTKTIKKL